MASRWWRSRMPHSTLNFTKLSESLPLGHNPMSQIGGRGWVPVSTTATTSSLLWILKISTGAAAGTSALWHHFNLTIRSVQSLTTLQVHRSCWCWRRHKSVDAADVDDLWYTLKFSLLTTFTPFSSLDFHIARFAFVKHNIIAVWLIAKAVRLVSTAETLTVQNCLLIGAFICCSTKRMLTYTYFKYLYVSIYKWAFTQYSYLIPGLKRQIVMLTKNACSGNHGHVAFSLNSLPDNPPHLPCISLLSYSGCCHRIFINFLFCIGGW